MVNAYGVKSGWSCGWQVKLCDPVNTCHSVALRDCLGSKNALYKYLILYFFTFSNLKKSKMADGRHLEQAKNVVLMDIINSVLKTGNKTANKNVKKLQFIPTVNDGD